MENTLVANISKKMARLVPFFLPFFLLVPPHAAASDDSAQLMRQADVVPPSSLQVHWQKGRSFAGYLSREQATYQETNGSSSADFSEGTTFAGLSYDRAVTPSIGSSLGLSYVGASSAYDSSHLGVTVDRQRTLTATILTADHTFKIMDTIVLAMRLGYRVHRLSYQNGTGQDGSQSAYVMGPAIGWKHASFEASLSHDSVLLRRKDDDGDDRWRRFGTTTAVLSGHHEGSYNWTLWYERNPQTACCTVTVEGRQAYGAAVFLKRSSMTFMPGYRYLSELSEKEGVTRIEDIARHQLFTGFVLPFAGGTPGLHFAVDIPASKRAQSSFANSSSDRSDVKASRWRLTGSWRVSL